MDLIELSNPHATEPIFLTSVQAKKWSFFVHSTTRSAPYVHCTCTLEACVDSRIVLDFPECRGG